jgi:hypothetical protein
MASKHAHALQDTLYQPSQPPHTPGDPSSRMGRPAAQLCSSLLIPLGSQRLSMLSAPVATLFPSYPPRGDPVLLLANPAANPSGPTALSPLSTQTEKWSGGGGEGESDFICTIGIPPALLPQPDHVTKKTVGRAGTRALWRGGAWSCPSPPPLSQPHMVHWGGGGGG